MGRGGKSKAMISEFSISIYEIPGSNKKTVWLHDKRQQKKVIGTRQVRDHLKNLQGIEESTRAELQAIWSQKAKEILQAKGKRLASSEVESVSTLESSTEEASKRPAFNRNDGKKCDTYEIKDDVAKAGNPIILASFPGAKELFVSQRKGSKGLRVATKRNEKRHSLMTSSVEQVIFNRCLQKIDPQNGVKAELLEFYKSHFLEWLWTLQLNFNLLLFGIGSKRALLEQFSNQHLNGDDVLSIDGSTGHTSSTRIVKSLLDLICSHILRQPQVSNMFTSIEVYASYVADALDKHYGRVQSKSSADGKQSISKRLLNHENGCQENPEDIEDGLVEDGPMLGLAGDTERADDDYKKMTSFRDIAFRDAENQAESLSVLPVRRILKRKTCGSVIEFDPSWGKRYAHAHSRLYILVNEIDAESLSNSESQQVLATLARCRSVSIIASADHVNTPLLWSPLQLSQFRWSQYHVPTYQPYEMKGSFSLLAGDKDSGSGGLDFIMRSLTPRHREVLELLSEHAVSRAQSSSAQTASRSIFMDDLAKLCQQNIICSGVQELKTILGELIDHRLVKISFDEHRKEILSILVSEEAVYNLTK